MRTGRKWTFFTAGIALLSLGLDAAAQKHAQAFPRIHDLKPAWAGPDFRGPNPETIPGASAGANSSTGVLPGQSRGPAAPSLPNDAPGRGGEMPHKSSNSGFPGRDKGKGKEDLPGENVQVSGGQAENAMGRPRQLHEIPTCQ